MIISWRGYGLLGFAPPLLSALLANFMVGGMGQEKFTITFQVLLLLCSVVMWFVGKRLNGDAEYEDAPHIFMWFRLQYVGVLYLLILLLHFVFAR